MARAGAVTPSEFFSGLRKRVVAGLPGELRRVQTGRGHSRLLKLYFDRPDMHFELWHHTGVGRLEVGLHFEGPGELNDRAFDFFRARMLEVKSRLPRAELEPWDRGWSRLYETLPAPQLDESVQDAAAERLVAYMKTLQPMLDHFLEGTGHEDGAGHRRAAGLHGRPRPGSRRGPGAHGGGGKP